MIGTVGSIPLPPLSTTTVVDKDRYHRRRHRPLPQSMTTIITAVKDNNQRRQLHPTAASIDEDHCGQRSACQQTLGWRHHRRTRPPSSPL